MKPFNFMQKMFKWALMPATAMVVTLSAQAAWDYPDMPATGPEVNLPDYFSSFEVDVPISTNKPVSGTPEIAEWTRQNQPGDTMVVSGEGLDTTVAMNNGVSSENLLANGSFDVDVSGWNIWTEGAATATWESGQVKIVTTASQKGIFASFTLTGGVEYTISAESTTASSAHLIRLCLGGLPNAGVYSTEASTTPTQFSFTYTPEVTAEYTLYVRLTDIGTVIWDNIRVAASATVTTNDVASESEGLVGFVFAGHGVVADGVVRHVDGRQAAVTLPTTLPSNDFYLMWPLNEYGFGEPVGINQTEADWVGFDTIAAGDTFYIYGKSLTLDGEKAYCYVKELDKWLTSTNCNPYKAEFVMPATATNGIYTLYAHNGHGGKYGWADALTITVEDAYAWSGTVFDVSAYGADGTDTNSDQAAFESAIAVASSGDTLYIPNGTYLVEGFSLSKRLHWVGESTNAVLKARIDAQLFGASSSGFYGSKFESLTLSNPYRAVLMYMYSGNIDNNSSATFTNVVFSQIPDAGQDLIDYGNSVVLDQYRNVLFQDCVFYTVANLYLKYSRQVRFDGCRFYGIYDNNQIITTVSSYTDFTDCFAGNYDASDASSSFGWAKGRWVVQNSGDYMYFGGNTVSNMAPRIPTPFVDANLVSWSSLGPATNAYSLGNIKLATLTFDDVPDEYQDRGNGSVDWSGVVVSIPYDSDGVTKYFDAWMYRNDAISDQVQVWVKEGNWDEYELIVAGNTEFTDKTDQNSGEQILCEGYQTLQSGYVLAGTSNSVTISVADATESTAVDDAPHVFITGGTGLGQARNVDSVDTATGLVTIDGEWRVIPDETSAYTLAIGALNYIVYDNYFSARKTGLEYEHKATTSLQITASHGLVYANNTLEDMRHLVRLYGYCGEGTALSNTSAPGPNYFAQLKNNTANGTARGFLSHVGTRSTYALGAGDTFCMGNVFRGNEISNVTYKAAFEFSDSNDSNTIGLNVLDGNIVSDLRSVDYYSTSSYAEVLAYNDYVSPLVLVGNRFEGHSKISGLTSTNVILQGNTWSGGFDPIYSVNYSRVAAPNAISTDGTLIIQNAGTDDLNWQIPELDMSGIITPEQSTKFTDIAEGSYTISAGTQSRTVKVVHWVQLSSSETASSLAQLVYPLYGYDDVWLKCELVAHNTGQSQVYGPWYGAEEIALPELDEGGYTLIIMTSESEDGPYSVVVRRAIGWKQ